MYIAHNMRIEDNSIDTKKCINKVMDNNTLVN